MTQAAEKDRFDGTGRALGRAVVACACAAALATARPVGAREPAQVDPAAATEQLNELAQKHAFKAIEHFNNGAYADSEEEFQRVAFYAPNWRPLHFNLGVLAEAQGKVGEAVREYKMFRPLGSPEEQLLVDQRIDELGRRKGNISAAYRRQIALAATGFTLGAGGVGGGAAMIALAVKYGKDEKELKAQADAIYMMDPAEAEALRGEAAKLDKRRGIFVGSSIYLILFGALVAGGSFIALSKALKSKRQLEGLALGRTRLKWDGGAGFILRF